MVQFRETEPALDGAEAMIRSSVDDALDAEGIGGAEAHGTGFESAIKSRIQQTPVPEIRRGGLHCEDLGMGRRIVSGLHLVARRENPALRHDNRTDRNFVVLRRHPGLLQGHPHVHLVSWWRVVERTHHDDQQRGEEPHQVSVVRWKSVSLFRKKQGLLRDPWKMRQKKRLLAKITTFEKATAT